MSTTSNSLKTFVLVLLSVVILSWLPTLSYAGPGTLATEAAASPSGGTFYANSPAGIGQNGTWYYTDALGATRSSDSGKPLRKFVDSLPGLGLPDCVMGSPADPNSCHENNLGQYIPVAKAKTPPVVWGIPANSPPDSDYYEIGIVDYQQQLHSDLPATTHLRGYVDLNANTPKARYLGPVIIATKDKPVRLKVQNLLSGNLMLPLDTTFMGAGDGPPVLVSDNSIACTAADEAVPGKCVRLSYSQNRQAVHLHGGHTPWISDGTPHQWFTPANDTSPYKVGASFQNVPDMFFDPTNNYAAVLSTDPNAVANPGPGYQTLYYTNQQSARMMFYHDHALGTTRLNVYDGVAAGYLIVDPAIEDPLITAGTLPGQGLPAAYKYGIPLVIQDKTFVPADVAVQDAKWSKTNGGTYGDLWFPHVYETNQDPNADGQTGANDFGRWDYGPWFWPPVPVDLTRMSPYAPQPVPEWDVTATPEAFMDTPLVNGTAYPYLDVAPQAYRFRILNAANDRPFNLQMYVADPGNPDNIAAGKLSEVSMVPAAVRPDCTAASPAAVPAAPSTCTCTALYAPFGCFPATWPSDGRAGGVPDPQFAGPKFVQIGSESGFLPNPVVIQNQPVSYEYNRRNIVVLDILDKSLLVAPAERADVIVDFSKFAGKTIILYNDAPAPMPAFDTRYDYYTNNPDQLAFGGSPPTLPGYGPNTRTIMQFRVAAGTGQNSVPLYDDVNGKLATLTTKISDAFKLGEPPLIPEIANGGSSDVYGTIYDTSLTFTPALSATPKTIGTKPKAIQELWDNYGRMNATLGVELPWTNNVIQTTIPLGYNDPVTERLNNGETQIWKITHNGVDTHPVHFHLVDVQVVNRVGWDGAIRPPDANEVGWKETVRMKPLEDIFIALKPTLPTLPFTLPTSQRLHDPTQPLGAVLAMTSPVDGNPVAGAPSLNAVEDFGHEYVWHCHILGHEENDFMRPVVFNVQAFAPPAPVLDVPTTDPQKQLQVFLAWTEGVANGGTAPANEFVVKRATAGIGGPYTVIATVANTFKSSAPTKLTYTDTTVLPSTQYWYQIDAVNGINTTSSNSQTLTTPAWAPTTVTLTTPADLATFASPATVTFTAATTTSATITRVDFFVGTTRIATKTTGPSPYTFVWSNVPPGTYVLSAKAYDSLGVVATSNQATVTVNATPPGVTLTPDKASPQFPGTAITFTAAGSGGTGSYEYQFYTLAPGGSWTMRQAYSTTSTFAWNTTGLAPGAYSIGIWVKSAGSSPANGYDAYTIVNYTVSALPPATGATLTPNKVSPQIASTTITFTAGGIGGTGSYEYQFYTLAPGGGWTMRQAYSTTNTFAWNTSGLASGAYQVAVWVKSAGSSPAAGYDTYAISNYTLTVPPSATGATITPDKVSPQNLGTTVTFTAGGIGGTGSYEYQFYTLAPGGGWTMRQAYSSTNTFAWNTSGLASGAYQVAVWVRSAGSSPAAGYDTYAISNYTLTTPPPATGATITPDKVSPQNLGTTVTFTAGGIGGTGSYEYQFYTLAPGGGWTMRQAYSSTNTFVWNTNGLAAGNYQVGVWAKSAGSSPATGYDTYTIANYALTP